MPRRVFFSFHFEEDIWRVNQVRNANVVAGPDWAGFYDHSEYIEAKKKGEDNIKRLIRQKLKGTSVTVVLIGRYTAGRKYVKYEIQQSIARANGLLGVLIHNLENQNGDTSYGFLESIFQSPAIPRVPKGVAFPIIEWDGDLDGFRKAIELAGRRSDKAKAR
jgi:hypothetical protein